MSPILLNPYVSAAAAASTPDVILGSKLLAWYKRGTGIDKDNGSGGYTPVTSNLDEVQRWQDQTANAYHMIRQPSGSGNLRWRTDQLYLTKGTIDFGGGSGGTYMTVPDAVGAALSSTGKGEMFVASKALVSGGSNGAWKFNSTGDNSHFPWSDGNIYEAFGTTSRKTVGNPGSMTGAFHVYDVYSDAGDFKAFFDSPTSALFSTASNTVSFPTSGLKFGQSTSGYGLGAYVSEVVLVNGVCTSGERSAMYAYLTT